MQTIKVRDFSLEHTLECGQFFRYRKIGRGYAIFSSGKDFFAMQKGSTLLFRGATKKFVLRFFALDENYGAILRKLKRDKIIGAAIAACPGIRILRQNPRECLVDFICSAASNIPRITKNVAAIHREFGKKKIDNVALLRKCGVGFRAKYIAAASRIATAAFFRKLKRQSYENAKQELMKLPGIGEKVADCILLFSLGFYEAFPVDTWIRRAMQALYFNNRRVSDDKIRLFAKKKFGKYAGIAQQYLYCWWRTDK